MEVNRLAVTRFRLPFTSCLDKTLSFSIFQLFHKTTSTSTSRRSSKSGTIPEPRARVNMGGLVKLSSLPVPEEQNAPESVQTSVKELKAELLGCFKQIGNSDNVVTFAAMYRFPNPGLHLKYAGGIGLPLSDNDARTIIATSRQTPFGPGSKMNGDSVATNT